MSKKQIDGYNSRYRDRFGGFDGAKGLNVMPTQTEQSWAATGTAGNYDGSVSVPINCNAIQVMINVTEVFDGTPTIIVGYSGDTDLLVTLANAVDLTTTGVKTVVCNTINWPATAVPRAVIGGSPTVGAATITFQWEF